VASGRGMLVTLTPRERLLINDAVHALVTEHITTPAEREIADNLLRRVPKPEPIDLK
jgi:hypothetical protein